MKQKKYLFTFAASMLLAAGMVSCTKTDNPIGPDIPEEPELPVGPYAFDEGSLVVNGQCDGAEVQSYWCHEWRPDGYVDGPAQIIADPADPTNRCAVVVIRSKEEAQAAGNATVTDDKPLAEDFSNYADWDSQFFITLGEEQALKAKDKIRLTMRVKADAAQTVGTQAHAAPGAYLDWFCVCDVNFTTEWTDFDSGFVPIEDAPGGWPRTSTIAGMYTIAFNLAKGIHNTVYFDDIRVEVLRYDPFDEGNYVKNGRCERDDASNFWCHEWRTMEAQFDGNANIVADPADPTNHCAAVVVRSTEEALAAGNMIKDGDNIAGWDSQFFITIPEDQALKNGDKLQLKMRVKADAAQVADSQSHTSPGAYIHWYCVGDVNFTTEWTDFDSGEITVTEEKDQWGKAQAGMHTIAFNLAKGIHNTVYFDDIQLFITRAE